MFCSTWPIYSLYRTLFTFQGTRLARDIGAKYFECSAKENINVNGVIHAATLEALKPRGLTKKFCSIL